jgi:hypothetical protein
LEVNLEPESDEYSRDIEEENEVLDSVDEDAPDFWKKRQKDLVTSVLDYNLNTLSELVSNKAIDLSPRYQRRDRWDQTRQSRLIESFLMNVPVPPVFLNEDAYGTYSVIDGKQRLTAIHEFLRGRLKLRGLKVFSEINGQNIDSLPSSMQNIVKTRANIRAVIVLRQSDPEVKFEVFRRLNTGGVKLNPQEIRNSTWPGPLNDLILDLSINPTFHSLLGIKNRQRSAIYKEMRDAELVLRFLTFRDTWETFRGGMMRHLDSFMANHQKPTDAYLKEARSDFLNTLSAVKSGLDGHAFQRWVPGKNQWRQQVLASLFDAEMFAMRGIDPARISPRRAKLTSEVQGLFSSTEFRKSIDAATNTPQLFKSRIRAMRDLIASVIGG